MNIRYQDYLNSISAFLCESYDCTASYSRNMIEELMNSCISVSMMDGLFSAVLN